MAVRIAISGTAGRILVRGVVILAGAAILHGCEQRAAPEPQPAATKTGSDYALPSFVGKVWMSTTLGSPLGSIKVFLPDNTVLMDSCFETYRIAQWGIVAEDRIRWVEDSIPIEAQFEQPTRNTLRLRIVGQSDEETYVEASVPYVCPDMPR